MKTKFELATGVYLYPATYITPDRKETSYYFASAEERREAQKRINKFSCGKFVVRPKIFVLFGIAEKLYTETLNKIY